MSDHQSVMSAMRWEHVAGFSVVLGTLGALWRWMNKHVKALYIKLNGVEIKKGNHK